MTSPASTKTRFILFLLLCMPVLSFAQKKLSFSETDSLAERAFQSSEWKKVVTITRSGFHSGYDNFSIRMRVGMAQLNRNNPLSATTHFRKALEFRKNDPVALENLYTSLILSGDQSESRLLAYDYSPAFRQYLGIPASRHITNVFFEPGYLVNTRATEMKAFLPDAELAQVYLVPAYWSLSTGINLEAGQRFSGTVSANILSYKAIQQFLIRNLEPLVFDVPFDQRGVYLGGNYYLGKRFNLGLAAHIMSYTIPLYSRVSGESGAEYLLGGYSYTDLAFNASFTKRFPYATVGLLADVNRFKGIWYKQAGAEITAYPFGNINIYLKAGGTWIFDGLNPPARFVARGVAGAKLIRSWWLEAECAFGDITNLSEKNAYVVFNNFDPITKRLGINLMGYRILPHLDISLRYQYTQRTATWQIFENSQYIRDERQNYPVHSFITGLTWRF